MAVFKCKMCGGDLDVKSGLSVVECEYCGTKQTVPKADDEKKLTLFSRAGRLLRTCEFDKAAGIFEALVADFPEEAEAYWGLVLCKYGIEYVDDPKTGKKVPTCHRSSFDSVFDDSNFEQACENADALARSVYRDEAKAIEELRKDIIEVSSKEEPYDIFICYKEADENGDRTLDSVLAQDIYDALTEKGYRVFFARVSLEDRLGKEYEPYIFAALNSAKVMLAIGTSYEYYNAVWVKNEWSRFLSLIASGEKKTLIPCYKGIDAYDMPKEFTKLSAQDLGKVGAMQDLLRGIEKVLGKKQAEPLTAAEPQRYVSEAESKTVSILKRGYMALEDGEWDKADKFFEEVLNYDAENAQAYLGKLLAELRVRKESELKNCDVNFENNSNYQRTIKFADAALKRELEGYCATARKKAEAFRAHSEEAARKRKKKVAIIVPAVIACIALLFVITKVIIPTSKLKNADVGDYITFGKYEQDNDTANGKEDIEWLVLAKENGKSLVISKYALDCQQYNTEKENVTWESCSLRKWLNNTFLNDAFNAVEKAIIQNAKVSADKNPQFDTDPGNATTDKIFLLSINEANRYFSSDEARKCAPTEYAVANGAFAMKSGNCWWWLRSPGIYQNAAAFVSYFCSVEYYGHHVYIDDIAVRPAMWLDIG